MAVQPDGKIVVAAEIRGLSRYCAANPEMAAFRLRRNGKLDTRFGKRGKVDLDRGIGQAVAIQADGKILVGGGNKLVRLNSDGSLDSSFGENGVIGGAPQVHAITPARDGGILLGSQSRDCLRFCLAVIKLRPNGAPDPAFGGGDATALAYTFDGSSEARRVIELPDGDILAGGPIVSENDRDPPGIFFARFDTTGELDPQFSNDGSESVRGPTADYFEAHRMDIAAAPGGEIYGAMRVAPNIGLVKLTPSGAVDPTFGPGGFALLPAFTPQERIAWPTATLATSSGALLSGGTTGRLRRDFRDVLIAAQDFALARTGPTGNPDPGFGGGDGTAAFDFFTGSDETEDIAIAPDGGIVQVGGAANGFSREDIAVARYTNDLGRPDADADGLVNRKDRCPSAYAKRHRGCPRLALRLTLKYQRGRERFRGNFTSKFLACLRERVAIKRVRDGEDPTIARTRLIPGEDVYQYAHSPIRGRFYAQLTDRNLATRGKCSAEKSAVIKTG